MKISTARGSMGRPYFDTQLTHSRHPHSGFSVAGKLRFIHCGQCLPRPLDLATTIPERSAAHDAVRWQVFSLHHDEHHGGLFSNVVNELATLVALARPLCDVEALSPVPSVAAKCVVLVGLCWRIPAALAWMRRNQPSIIRIAVKIISIIFRTTRTEDAAAHDDGRWSLRCCGSCDAGR